MDSVSQALFGGLSGSAFSRRTNLRRTFVAGAIGGSVPDLDAWVGKIFGPVQERVWHRGPTHSLVLLGILGLSIFAIKKRWPQRSFEVLQALWLGAFTHPLLDILTGFETAWGYPFFEPSSLGWFPVLEPVMLLILVLATLSSLWKRRSDFSRRGLMVLSVWIFIVGAHHQWVRNKVSGTNFLPSESAPISARPMLGSFLTYRVVWFTTNDCYVAGFQPFSTRNAWSGVHRLPRVIDSAGLPAALLDKGCFVQLESGEIGDLRFALTPDSPNPLWLWSFENGVLERRANRRMTPELRRRFLAMLRGVAQVDWTIQPRLVEP